MIISSQTDAVVALHDVARYIEHSKLDDSIAVDVRLLADKLNKIDPAKESMNSENVNLDQDETNHEPEDSQSSYASLFKKIQHFDNLSIVLHNGMSDERWASQTHLFQYPADSPGKIYNHYFPIQSALGFDKHIIYLPDVTALAGNTTSKLDVEYHNLASAIPQDLLEKKNSVLVFDGSGEAMPGGVLAIVAKFARQHKSIPCYYISAASPDPVTFETFRKFRGSATNLQLMTQNTFESIGFTDYEEFNIDLSSSRDKKFHWFLGGCRPHRYMLLALLAERDVLHHGILSYGWQGNSLTPMEVLEAIEGSTDEYRESFKNIIEVCKKYLPTLPAVQNPYSIVDQYLGMDINQVATKMPDPDIAIYNNTFFEITTESSNATSTPYDNDGWMYPSTNPLFLTEKTFRPLIAGLASVTVSQQGHFKYLESQGYEPFDTGFTLKTIDSIYNDEERMIAQADYIAEMCNWPDTHLYDNIVDYQPQAKRNKNIVSNARRTLHLHAL